VSEGGRQNIGKKECSLKASLGVIIELVNVGKKSTCSSYNGSKRERGKRKEGQTSQRVVGIEAHAIVPQAWNKLPFNVSGNAVVHSWPQKDNMRRVVVWECICVNTMPYLDRRWA